MADARTTRRGLAAAGTDGKNDSAERGNGLSQHPAPDDRHFMGGVPLDFLQGGGWRQVPGRVARDLLIALWTLAQDQREARQTGRVQAHDARIQQLTGARIKSLTRARAALQDLGLIRIVRTGNQYGATIYQLSKAIWRWSEWCGCAVCIGAVETAETSDAHQQDTASAWSTGQVHGAPVLTLPRDTKESEKEENAVVDLDLLRLSKELVEIKGRIQRTKVLRLPVRLPNLVRERIEEGISPEDLRHFVEAAARHSFWQGVALPQLCGEKFDEAWEQLGPRTTARRELPPEKELQRYLQQYREALRACEMGEASELFNGRTNREIALDWEKWLWKQYGLEVDPPIPAWLRSGEPCPR